MTERSGKEVSVMRHFVSLCLLSLLAGCASTNVGPAFSLAAAKARNHGLLIASVSSDTPDTTFSADTSFELADIHPGPGVSNPHFNATSSCQPKEVDFEGCGRLVAIEVNAGTYRFTWMIYPNLGNSIYIQPIEWRYIEVTIRPGEAVYIGSLHMQLTAREQEVTWGWPVASDQSARDMALLLRRYPSLRPSDIHTRLLDLPPFGDDVIFPGPGISNPPQPAADGNR